MNRPRIRPVVAIGAIHSDTLAHASEPIRPETSTPSRLTAKPGGVATNVARVLNRLGVDTTLVGALGEDTAAPALEAALRAEGLALALVRRQDYPTGQYVALHDPDGSLKAACVDDRVLAEAPADTFDSALAATRANTGITPIWFVDANVPDALLARTLSHLNDGILVANAVSDAKSVRLHPHLDRIDCLTLNRGEAAALLQRSETLQTKQLAGALAETGLRSFLLTDSGADLYVWADGEMSILAPPASNIVDVTGAGDALTAGLVAAMARGIPVRQAAQIGLAAAAMTLQCTGAMAENMSWEAIAQA